MIFYAHSVENSDEQNWQPLQQHLHNTAALAREFAAYYPQNAQALAETAALMHDKANIPFRFKNVFVAVLKWITPPPGQNLS